MEEHDVLEWMLELASEAGLRVQIAGREARGGDALPLASGVCRVRGEWWVVLSSSEPASAQIATLASAIKNHAETLLEERHLPPAVRRIFDEVAE